MSIEEAIQGGIVFKGKKDKPKEEEKVKTKAKKATYIRGQARQQSHTALAPSWGVALAQAIPRR